MVMKNTIDRRFRAPRTWSNAELRKFGKLFTGDVVNVSAWADEDKEGGKYRDYFGAANSYSITNFKAEARGFQGEENEIFLDLTKELPPELVARYDVVFNHTTLEHIFEVDKAFENLCRLSKDIVIVVVPFLQEMHGYYGDYWRFTPLALKELFEKQGLSVLYLSFNTEPATSVYVFAVASRLPDSWKGLIDGDVKSGLSTDKTNGLIGYNAFGSEVGRDNWNRRLRRIIRLVKSKILN